MLGGLALVAMVACGDSPAAIDAGVAVERTEAVAQSPTAAVSTPARAASASEQGTASEPSPAPSTTEPARSEGVPAAAQPAVVERIVDGDTFWVRVDAAGSGPLPAGATHKIRLLEYDSPEATSSTECFGPEATQRLASLTPVGSGVWLEADDEDTDRYGRFLRYVWLADGTMVNLVMVREGFGEAVLYEPNDAHIELLRAAEEEARAAGSGMWGAPCDYDAPAPASAPSPAEETSTSLSSDGSCDPSYPDVCIPPKSEVGDLDCGDISHRRFRVLPPDPHGFDGNDNDGLGCES